MTFKRGARWWGLALLLLAAAGGLLRWQPWRGVDRQESRPAAASSPLDAWRAMAGPGSTDGAAFAVDGQSGIAAAERGADAASQSIEVCGVGRVGRQQAEDWHSGVGENGPAWQRAVELRKSAALSALAARLAAGSDGAQVAARLLMNDVEGAALIASRSRDATAYRLALARCGAWTGAQAAPHCQALTTMGWAQLDPDDGRPWMVMAAEALNRRDDAAVTEALEQALRRSKNSPSSPLLAVAANARAGVADEAGLGLAMIDVIGMDAALPVRETILGLYCRAEGVKDVSRRNRCERLARWQLEHADSALEALISIGIADRVGLPADQRPYTREQVNRGLTKMADQFSQVLGFDCAALRGIADLTLQRATQGELQMALKAAAQR